MPAFLTAALAAARNFLTRLLGTPRPDLRRVRATPVVLPWSYRQVLAPRPETTRKPSILFEAGVDVRVQQLLVQETYADILEGRATRKLADHVMARRLESADRVLNPTGILRWYVVPPLLRTSERGEELPRWFLAADVIRYTVEGPSSALVAWLQDAAEPLLGDEARLHLSTVVWDAIAISHEYD